MKILIPILDKEEFVREFLKLRPDAKRKGTGGSRKTPADERDTIAPAQRKRRRKYDVEMIRRMRQEERMSIQEIADALGATHGSIKAFVARNRIIRGGEHHV